MRRSAVLVAGVLLLVGPALVAGALSRSELDRVIDFSVTLKSLAAAAQDGGAVPQGRVVLLSGTVSDVNVVNKDPADFRVRLELITGEWIGLEDVKSYTCYVDFAGSEYARLIPARPPREANRDLVTLNSRVIVIGRVVGVTSTALGGRQALVDGAFIRPIE
ncbi:MAG TPA: hypothetical protein VFI08_13170 [Spirochaetia bacterium]|nr:hypothetical protein [Spirochaetia bacterium]